MLHVPRNTDLKKYNLENKLNDLTVNDIIDIQYDYAINNDKIDKFHAKLSDELNENNDDVLVIGYGDEILVFENLKPNDTILIENSINEDIIARNLNFSTSDIRFEYLLYHPEKIDKIVAIEAGEQFDKCPFCESPVGDEKYCKKCGQMLDILSMGSMLKDLTKVFIKRKLFRR